MTDGNVKLVSPCRGEVWKVKFEPTKGDEITKTRPAIVISSDAVGKLAIRVVVPVTTWKDEFSDNIWMVRLEPDESNGLERVSTADALQVRSLSLERFIEKLGQVPSEVLDDITAAIAIVVEYQ